MVGVDPDLAAVGTAVEGCADGPVGVPEVAVVDGLVAADPATAAAAEAAGDAWLPKPVLYVRVIRVKSLKFTLPS
jgi:hypothetical protein